MADCYNNNDNIFVMKLFNVNILIEISTLERQFNHLRIFIYFYVFVNLILRLFAK